MLGRDSEGRTAERRRLVLEAALELFGTPGYPSATVEALCKKAGVGTNSSYDLYTSKEELLVDLDKEMIKRFSADREAFIRNLQTDDAVRPTVDGWVRTAVGDRQVARVVLIESVGVSPRVTALAREFQVGMVEGLQRFATAHPDLGAAGAVPFPVGTIETTGPAPRRNAVALVGAMTAMTLDWLDDPGGDSIEKLVDDVTFHTPPPSARHHRAFSRSDQRNERGAASAVRCGRPLTVIRWEKHGEGALTGAL